MMNQRWGLDRNVLRPTPGDPWGVEQHHRNTGAKENQQLNPGGPSNRQKTDPVMDFTQMLCLCREPVYQLTTMAASTSQTQDKKVALITGITGQVDCFSFSPTSSEILPLSFYENFTKIASLNQL